MTSCKDNNDNPSTVDISTTEKGLVGLRGSMSDWESAFTKCAEHAPAVTNATWKLPSKDDWEKMASAAGGFFYLLDQNYERIGGKNLQPNVYWTSMEYDSEDAWFYDLSCGEFRHYYKTKRLLFRPVLAF